MWMNAKTTVVEIMQHAMMVLLHIAVNVPLDGVEPIVNQVNSKKNVVYCLLHIAILNFFFFITCVY